MATSIIPQSVGLEVFSSGSLKDIKASGIYYLTGSVTDKPDANGGLYIYRSSDAISGVGLFIPLYGEGNEIPYIVRNSGGTYSNYKLAQIKVAERTYTPSSSGAVAIPQDIGANNVLNVSYADSHVGLVYMRDGSYFTCVNNAFAPVTDSVKLRITYKE